VLEASFHETQILLRAAAANRTPLLLTSTSEVYGKSRKAAFGEDDDLLIGPPGQSRWSYACSKLTDEFLALAYAREKNLPVVIAAAKKNEPLKVFGNGRQTRCFCHVRDAVEALVRLQNCPKARDEIFNVGGTEEISILELARLVVKTLGSKSKIKLIPYDKAYSPGFDDMQRRKPMVKKLERFVEFRPRTLLREIILMTAHSG